MQSACDRYSRSACPLATYGRIPANDQSYVYSTRLKAHNPKNVSYDTTLQREELYSRWKLSHRLFFVSSARSQGLPAVIPTYDANRCSTGQIRTSGAIPRAS